MRVPPDVVFREKALDTVLALGEGGVLAKLRSRDLVVLAVDLGGAGLTALVCIAPDGHTFGQEYWLGQTYLNWHLTYGLTERNFEAVAASLKADGFRLADIPYAIVNFGSGGFANATPIRRDWDRNIFQTFVVPTDAISVARAAIQASAPIVSEFLYGPDVAYLGVEARYGECPLEKLFARTAFGYRRPINLPVPPATTKFGSKYVEQQLADMQNIEADLNAGQLVRVTNWRWLTYRPLDCRDFDRDQWELVAEINLRKSRLIRRLELPHFYYELFLRRVDTSANRRQSSYNLLRNDMDWMEILRSGSPHSFSSDFEERSVLLEYIGNTQKRYPFLARDPLGEVLPKLKLNA